MNVIELSDEILEILGIVQGSTYEEKIRILAIEKIKLNLEECNREILKYELKYGVTFDEFKDLWNKGEISNRYSHEIETDYIQWEALEMEKKHWLAILKNLRI